MGANCKEGETGVILGGVDALCSKAHMCLQPPNVTAERHGCIGNGTGKSSMAKNQLSSVRLIDRNPPARRVAVFTTHSIPYP